MRHFRVWLTNGQTILIEARTGKDAEERARKLGAVLRLLEI